MQLLQLHYYVTISCRFDVYLYQILVAFAGFSLEVWVGRICQALVCLCPLLLIQSGTQLQNTVLGTLDAGTRR